MLILTFVLVVVDMTVPLFNSDAYAGELKLKPIKIKPEPLSDLHPKLKWMTEGKIRGIWIGDDIDCPQCIYR